MRWFCRALAVVVSFGAATAFADDLSWYVNDLNSALTRTNVISTSLTELFGPGARVPSKFQSNYDDGYGQGYSSGYDSGLADGTSRGQKEGDGHFP